MLHYCLRPLDFPFALSCRRNPFCLHRVLVGCSRPSLTVKFTRGIPSSEADCALILPFISRENTLNDIKVLASDGKFEDQFPYCGNWIHLETWSTSLFYLRWGHLRWGMAAETINPKVCYYEIRVRASDPWFKGYLHTSVAMGSLDVSSASLFYIHFGHIL